MLNKTKVETNQERATADFESNADFNRMFVLIFVVTVGVVCSLCHSGGPGIQQNFTLAMTDMIVDTEWIYDDCREGVLSDISFNSEYAYALETSCRHNTDPMIPVEWTSGVKALEMYGVKARNEYAMCILNRTCENINMTDWRQLASEQYKACEYCISVDADGECTTWKTEAKPSSIQAIINTMFIVTKFTCTIDTATKNALIVPVVHSSQGNTSVINVIRDNFNCSNHNRIQITHATEQANNFRVKVRRDNLQLVERVQSSLTNSGTIAINISDQDWSIQGTNFWIASERRQNPSCIIITYNCGGGGNMTGSGISTG